MHSSTVTCVMLMCVVSFGEVLSDDELRCYKCTSIRLEDNKLLLEYLPHQSQGRTHKSCKHLSVSDAFESCPNSTGYMCSYFEGRVSFVHLDSILGHYNVTVQKRGCMKVNQTQGEAINQCKPVDSDDDNEREFVGAVLSVLPESATNMTLDKIDGEMCVCGTDLCDANCKGVAFFHFCLSLPVAIVLGIVIGILALLIVTCCCCCCCCKCCKVNSLHLSLVTKASGGSPYSHLQEEGLAV